LEDSPQFHWVDSHCHLEDPQFNEDREGVLERARQAGVNYVLTLGSDILSSRKAVELAQSLDPVYAGVGIHPHEAKKAGKRTFATLTKLSAGEKVVAVGEVGLDYYRSHSPKDVQQQVFRNQIRIAKKVGRPLVLHERESHKDMMRILREEGAWEARGVIHCFTGNLQDATDYLDLDFYVSFAGPVTFAKADELQEVARQIPLERLLVETDGPYLTPAPFRGKRPNEPAMVVHVAEKLAELLDMPLEDLARITSHNASVRHPFDRYGPPDGLQDTRHAVRQSNLLLHQQLFLLSALLFGLPFRAQPKAGTGSECGRGLGGAQEVWRPGKAGYVQRIR
jgi:TatD DNase family protein